MRIALYEPDIPQNTGTILRLCACLGIEAHIIEPAGFPVTDRAFRRAGMDYLDRVTVIRHGSFEAFQQWRTRERLSLVLFSTKAKDSYLDHVSRNALIQSSRDGLNFWKFRHKLSLQSHVRPPPPRGGQFFIAHLSGCTL